MESSAAPFSSAALPLSARLEAALSDLFSRAPAQLFPRARRLYFDKYPLEGHPDQLAADVQASPFRTFVLSEVPPALEEPPSAADPAVATPGDDGTEGVGAPAIAALALVHWQAAEIDLDAAIRYLEQHWQLEAAELQPMAESWFRDGGAWVRISPRGAAPEPAPAPPASNG
jgi:hypothetical protein